MTGSNNDELKVVSIVRKDVLIGLNWAIKGAISDRVFRIDDFVFSPDKNVLGGWYVHMPFKTYNADVHLMGIEGVGLVTEFGGYTLHYLTALNFDQVEIMKKIVEKIRALQGQV